MSDHKITAIQTINHVLKYKINYASLASEAIFHDVCDRNGIKNFFRSLPKDAKDNMKSVWEEIIKECVDKYRT